MNTSGVLEEAATRRSRANHAFFARESDRIARLCHHMAERFARGGRLVAVGRSPADRSDARHVAVEFVHPVIVGKRALPALALTPESGPLALQADLLARPDDILIAFGGGEAAGSTRTDGPAAPDIADAVALARSRGCLTVAFADVGTEWEFLPGNEHPFIRQEIVETLYHVLWELVHVFFEHPGLLEGGRAGSARDVGGSHFLYPFLGNEETGLDDVIEDVRGSVMMKAEEVAALRERTLDESGGAIVEAARTLRRSFEDGGTLLAMGNGGSATDAMDLVADLRAAPTVPGGDAAAAGPAGSTDTLRGAGGERWPARPALDLTEDTGVITAVANDVGTDAIFARQVIAYGREGDVALALSTSGSSRNIVRALEEARRRGLHTVALVGYDGGRIAAENLADHVIVAPSEHIPRIQEAHASAYHVLRELVEVEAGASVGEPA